MELSSSSEGGVAAITITVIVVKALIFPGLEAQHAHIVPLLSYTEIARHFRFGSQEDAHEFLRYTIDAMQKACLNGYPK